MQGVWHYWSPRPAIEISHEKNASHCENYYSFWDISTYLKARKKNKIIKENE